MDLRSCRAVVSASAMAAVLLVCLPLSGGDYFPTVVNDKKRAAQCIPLGPVGACAAIEKNAIRAQVLDVCPDGPGWKAGLQVDDWIIAADGHPFAEYSGKEETGGDGFPRDMGLAILACQAGNRPLALTVERGEKPELVELKVSLPPQSDFSPTFPANCPRSDALLDAAVRQLLEMSQDDDQGLIGPKKSAYPNAFAALALMSVGDRRCLPTVEAVVERLAKEVREGGPSTNNWHCAATGILLAEHALATGKHNHTKELEACCRAIEQRLEEETGRLGHSAKGLPYGGRGLVITSMHAHLMWALADHAGVKVNDDKWELSYKSVKAAIGKDGSVGYNFKDQSPSRYQPMARTGGTLAALRLAGLAEGDEDAMVKWITSEFKRTTSCHTVTSMGLIFGMMGSKAAGPEVLRANLDYHRWLFALVTPFDAQHGVYYFAKRGNIGGDKYLGYRTVANYQVILMLTAARDDTLWCFGNRKKGWAR